MDMLRRARRSAYRSGSQQKLSSGQTLLVAALAPTFHQDRSAVLLPGELGRPVRLGQDLTRSAVLTGVALLLSHRDHKSSREASDNG